MSKLHNLHQILRDVSMSVCCVKESLTFAGDTIGEGDKVPPGLFYALGDSLQSAIEHLDNVTDELKSLDKEQ